MSDDATDKLWSVRGVPDSARKAITDAARRADQTVGTWLVGAAEHRIRFEREPADLALLPASDDRSHVSDDRSHASDDRSHVSDDLLHRIERAIAAAVALAGATDIPPGFRRAANRLLRDSLPAPMPRNAGAGAGAFPRLGAPAPAAVNGAGHPLPET